MKTNNNSPDLFARFLGIVPEYFAQCSKGTQQNLQQFGKALMFTVLVCGSILAASFCEFWLKRNYLYLPLVFIGSGLFYYLLDRAIILGDAGKYHMIYKRLRIVIALALGLFNSFLIDYYFFKSDIIAARENMITVQQTSLDEQCERQVKSKETEKQRTQAGIDQMEGRLARDLDSLNAEADGTGGSHQKGISIYWQSKYRSYQADSVRISDNISGKRAAIKLLDSNIHVLKTELDLKKARVPASISEGINMSLQLLHQVIWTSGSFTNRLMSLLILIVSMLLELIPLITKGFYDISQYFEKMNEENEQMSATSHLRLQKITTRETGKLLREIALDTEVDLNEHRLAVMDESLQHSRNVMTRTETMMDELEKKKAAWEHKYPALYERYGKPVIEKGYDTLSGAIDKVYA